MDFTFENAGINTYLVYRIKENDILDTMSLGMLTNNKINGLAATIFTQMDAERFIKYNVSAKISVKQFFTGPVNKARLLGVFNGIVNAMLSAEDYMIATESILLDTEYIFSDVSTCETILICLPVQTERQQPDLGSFFKNIMFNTQFDQTENCDYVARIINHLNSVPVFSLTEFKAVLDNLDVSRSQIQSEPKKSAPTEKKQPVTAQPIPAQPVVQTPPPVQVQRPVPTAPQKPVQPVVPTQTSPVSAPSSTPFNIPASQPQTQPVEPQPEGKKISMFDLLMHYNSENAAAYKAQKAAKKAGGASPTATPPAATPSGKKEKNSGKKKNQTQPASTSFAIPGQATPVSQTPAQPQTPNQPPVQPVRPIPQPVQPVTPIQQPVTPIPVAAQPVVQPPVTPRPVQTVSGANFGETTVLGGGVAGETTVLNAGAAASRQINPHLIRAKNNEIIPVNKPVFRIGKEKSYVDYFVADNTAISRSHANIITREDKYFIVDTNSTNHTFVNGQMIPSSTEVEITHGTKLRFANEDFTFQLY